MNRIVREHYPVENLPEDLREGLAVDVDVRVVIEARAPPAEPKTPFSFEELYALAKPSFSSPEEVADHIRSIRADGN